MEDWHHYREIPHSTFHNLTYYYTLLHGASLLNSDVPINRILVSEEQQQNEFWCHRHTFWIFIVNFTSYESPLASFFWQNPVICRKKAFILKGLQDNRVEYAVTCTALLIHSLLVWYCASLFHFSQTSIMSTKTHKTFIKIQESGSKAC